MKKLIICEKPSLAKNVVDGIKQRESFNRKDGYYESNNYIVSWAFGHLLELKNVSEYEGRKLKWSEIKLPYIPGTFQYKIKDDVGVKKQFKILKDLINSNEVEGIYNCGDNDEEGQILIDEILMASKNNKVTYRMILPDQTEKTVLSEIDRKALNSEYKNFANQGFARQRLDWLYGINTTLLLSIKSGALFNCGRLIAPIVKKIYDVDMSIKNFKPTTYYQCESDVDGIKLTVSDKFANSQLALELADLLNKETAVVKDITSKDTNKKPSKLFSLTSLQKYMNKNYKMKADEVLQLCQSLYEKKYQSYPRTDSEYMSEKEKDKVKEIINSLSDSNLEFKNKKTVFDNSKVEAHSALTPTTIIPNDNDLNEKERLVYNIVCSRFKANFCKEECIISTSEMVIECGSNEFKFKGEIMKQKGFSYYEPISNLKTLPNLKKGAIIKHKFKSVEKQTQPPKKMTQATLLSYLENPFRNYEEDEEIEVKELGLGTPATRSEIIKKCCLKYIEDKNNTLSITELGIKFIETIDKLNIDLYAEKTINISKNLKSVRNGEMTLEDCLNNAKKELIEICNSSNSVKIDKIENKKEEKEIIGTCPRCSKNVYEGKSNFYCEGFRDNPKCEFTIWKEDKFFKDKGKKVTKTMAKAFLKGNSVKVKGLKKKDGDGSYDALISMIEKEFKGKKYVNFNMSFE